MITDFSINNFRIFSEKTDFEISPITILTGPNNSGKSTLIRAIRLLVESAKSNSLLYLLRSSSDTDYISYIDVFGQGDVKTGTTFEFSIPLSLFKIENEIYGFESNLDTNCNIKLNYIQHNSDNSPQLILNYLIIKSMDGKIIFKIYQNKSLPLEYKYEGNIELFFSHNLEKILKKYSVRSLFKKLSLTSSSENEIIAKIKEDIEKNPYVTMNYDEFDKTDLIRKLIDIQGSLERNVSPGKSILGILSNRDQWTPDYMKYIENNEELLINNEDKKILATILASLKEEFFIEFDRFCLGVLKSLVKNMLTLDHYIPAFRGKMLREFGRNDSERISKTIFKLLDKNKAINAPFYVCTDDRILLLESGQYLKFVNSMLREIFKLNLKIEIKYNNLKHKYEILFNDERNKLIFEYGELLDDEEQAVIKSVKYADKFIEPTNLIDMGSGMYHLILFLIEIELAIIDGGYKYFETMLSEAQPQEQQEESLFYKIDGKSDHTIIIEEPELSLHPNYQSLLADVIEHAYNFFGVKFIIETHSEYLIRKLQLLTAKKYFKQNAVLIYNMNKPKNEVDVNSIRKIKIKLDGSLTQNFGPGFFDEADNIALNLFLLKKHQTN